MQVTSQGECIKIAGFHIDFFMKPVFHGAYFGEGGYNGYFFMCVILNDLQSVLAGEGLN